MLNTSQRGNDCQFVQNQREFVKVNVKIHNFTESNVKNNSENEKNSQTNIPAKIINRFVMHAKKYRLKPSLRRHGRMVTDASRFFYLTFLVMS